MELIQGEGGVIPMTSLFARARANWRIATMRCSVRRDPVRRGKTGHIFGYQLVSAGAAGYHDGGQADGLRNSAGRYHGE